MKSAWFSRGTFSREEGSAVRRQGLESRRSGRTSVGHVVLQWLVSASTCICVNPIVKFTVHLLQTASPADNRIVFSREELRRRKPRHSLHRVALGLCTEAESGIKSMRYRTTRNRNPREWAEISLAQSDAKKVRTRRFSIDIVKKLQRRSNSA
jgi:hypothetical protein